MNNETFDRFYNEFKDWSKEDILKRTYNIILDDVDKTRQIEQLENMRKEAIKLIEEDILGKKIENVNWDYDECYYSDMPVDRVKPLLNILKSNLSGDKDNIMEDKFTGTKGYYKGKEIWCMEYSNEEDKYKDSLKFLKHTLDQLLEENNNELD